MTATQVPLKSPMREASVVVRRRGLRTSLAIAVQCLRARWYLRNVTSMGVVRLMGRARVKNMGVIRLGNKVRLEGTTIPIELVAWRGGELSIGDGTYINYGTNVAASTSVSIGRNCAIGQYGIIMDDDYHSTGNHHMAGRRAPIVIEDDVWMGARVIVLRGAHIGRGAVIGANSVVTGHIPPRSVAVGSPARVIRRLEDPPDADD